ncbi:putative alcohol dehydrogenase [Aspergillus bertholletiae]|uniref:Putative alcohol dehydrogenase n=1 Tax=Aspergillus bertholletiae TaxID=1226010 RepID=A0A5N7BEG8_9EURO|nr:putative alcohol dehydrogenase [Aspergillus bertholletiae]
MKISVNGSQLSRAIAIDQVGSPAVLIDRPIPEPGDNQLLVRVTAASLNPVDQKTRDEGLFFKQSPQVLGHEIAGEVTKLGKGVNASRFSVGDHIFAQVNFSPGQILADGGALQQYSLVDARFAAKTNEAGLTDDEASTIPVCAIASFIGLFHPTGLGLPPPPAAPTPFLASRELQGNAILIIGGGSNCGQYAIQFAKLSGFPQIITIASTANESTLKSLGAAHVIDRYIGLEQSVRAVRAIVGDNLVYAFDAVNTGRMQDLGLATLSNSKKGRLTTLNRISEAEPDASLVKKKIAGYERGMTFGFSALYPNLCPSFWRHIAGWVKAVWVRPLPFAVNKILDGYRRGQGQKVVLKP